MRTAAVAVLAFLMLLPALPAQAQVGYHAGVAMDLWDRDAGYEEAYFLGGLSWTPGGWEYRASAAALVRQSDSSLKIGGEAAASRLFFRGSRLEPLLGVGATIYQTDDRPPIVVPPTVLVQPPPEAWGEGRRVSGVSGRPDRAGSLPEPGAGSPESYEDGWCCTRAATVR